MTRTKTKLIKDDEIVTFKSQLEKLGMSNVNIDFQSPQSIISGLLLALTTAISNNANWRTKNDNAKKNEEEHLSKGQRATEDSLDAMWQRNLKGNFLINSPENPEKNLKTEILSDDQLREKNISFTDHIRTLVLKHYDVDIPREDISACHRLKSGSALLRVWNRKNEAPYHDLVGKVRSGGKAGAERKQARVDKTKLEDLPKRNVFICFQMTKKRSDIIKHLKSHKKSGKIIKFTSNHNGAISMSWIPKNMSYEKSIILTRGWDEVTGKTFTNKEIDDLLDSNSEES